MIQTGFEARGHVAPWTSFEEEHDYITQLLAAYPSITQGVAGTGSTGETIYYYTLGSGDRAMYIQAQQHGNEPSGRDALLTLLREWAARSDQAFLDYLDVVTLVLVPTARPDTLTSRVTATGVDPNRDNIALTQNEVRAYHHMLKTFRPEVVIDVHEGRNISHQYATSKTLNPNIDATIQDLSATLEDHVKQEIEGAEYTWEPYQGWNIYGAEYFTNAAALRNSVALLLESKRVDGRDSDMHIRHGAQIVALNAILDWHMNNLDVVEDAVTGAQRPPRTVLATGTSPEGPVLMPTPKEYLLSSEQLEDLATQIDLYDLAVRVDQGQAYLEGGTISDYVANDASPLKIVSATPAHGAPVHRTPVEDTYPKYYFRTSQGLERAHLISR